MERFTKIDDSAVIVQGNGVYRQVDVYRRGQRIFCRHGTGFVALYADGVTGIPKLRWDDIDIQGAGKPALVKDDTGRLALPPAFKQIEGSAK